MVSRICRRSGEYFNGLLRAPSTTIGREHPAESEGGNEGGRFPVAVGHGVDHPLAGRPPPVECVIVVFVAEGFVQENECGGTIVVGSIFAYVCVYYTIGPIDRGRTRSRGPEPAAGAATMSPAADARSRTCHPLRTARVSKYLDEVVPLLVRLHNNGTEADKAHNRQVLLRTLCGPAAVLLQPDPDPSQRLAPGQPVAQGSALHGRSPRLGRFLQ